MSFRYLGNKTKLSEWIVGEISKIIPVGSKVADPMCGTASVSLALALAGYSVTAADALAFPVIHAKCRLLIKQPPAFKAFGGYNKVINWLQSIPPKEGYFFNEFGDAGSPANGRAPRLYFSAFNAARIDGIRESIANLAKSETINELEHSLLLHSLILSTNKVANISGTYGYFLKELSKNAQQAISFEPLKFETTPGNHSVLRASIEEHASKLRAEAVYLDPPYTKRQYAGNYHILETLALEDEPIAEGDGGLRPWKEQASDFCYRRFAAKAFRNTLERLNTPHVFISYSQDGQVNEDELLSIFSDFGRVTIHQQSYNRYRSNNRAKDGNLLERLYHIHRY
ncbi:DNA adenine methylase [Sphingobacterium daejeonense]|uniref:DNA adenine methylase n=1 Tax=Sphingobacterium daejeonense TaxID=371142 RepID=UPI003D323ED5